MFLLFLTQTISSPSNVSASIKLPSMEAFNNLQYKHNRSEIKALKSKINTAYQSPVKATFLTRRYCC